MVNARMPQPLIDAIDSWAKRHADGSRSEAIRALVELGLAGSQSTRRRSPGDASRAADMAADQIDKLANPAASEEERHARKRRLIKGPREFREIRDKQSKRKG